MRKRMIFVISTLLVGILIYYLYNMQFLAKTDIISSFIRNYIPDFLWMISFYCLSAKFSKDLTKHYIIFTAIYVIILGVFFEILQLTGVVNGTFDIFDIITYIISTVFACLIEKYYLGGKL